MTTCLWSIDTTNEGPVLYTSMKSHTRYTSWHVKYRRTCQLRNGGKRTDGLCRLEGQWLVRLSVFCSALHWEEPRWEQIILFMGDVTPREEVSEEDKHKDKSSGRHLIFTTDEQTAGEGFLWAGDGDLPFLPLFVSLTSRSLLVAGRLWRQKGFKSQQRREEFVTFISFRVYRCVKAGCICKKEHLLCQGDTSRL